MSTFTKTIFNWLGQSKIISYIYYDKSKKTVIDRISEFWKTAENKILFL